jgi:hypothetical protein
MIDICKHPVSTAVRCLPDYSLTLVDGNKVYFFDVLAKFVNQLIFLIIKKRYGSIKIQKFLYYFEDC